MPVQNTDILYVERTVDRALASFLADDSPHKPVLLVEGARQVGNTCSVLHALDRSERDTVRLNLERDALARTVVPNPSTTVNERINEVFARLEAWHLL